MARTLDLPAITVDSDFLAQSTTREPFDDLALEMLARAGRMTEQVIAGVGEASADGLDRDQAVVGGLLVRCAKQCRGLFDTAQADESEAHLPLSRAAAETAITLSWLVRCGEAGTLRRFRADAFAYWRGQVAKIQQQDNVDDEVMHATGELVRRHVETELQAADVTWDEVPKRVNSWGPDMRQRCDQLGIDWIYDALFASHSHYVHPSWHEIRALHVVRRADAPGRVDLDYTYAGMNPLTGFIVARLIAEAARDASEALPCSLDADDVRERTDATVRASQLLSVEFSEFVARGGLQDDLDRTVTRAPAT